MTTKKGNQVHASIYLSEATYASLKGLSDRTRIPMSAYLREAVDDLLAKYKVKVTKPRAK